MSKASSLPSYAVCRCGETASAALVATRDGQVTGIACLNCRDTSHPWRCCTVCDRLLPAEVHHVASRSRFPALTILLCLNCHQILYARQSRWRRGGAGRGDGSAERHPLAYLVVGVLDVVGLFLERSPAATACRQLLVLLGRTALLALGSLRVEAFVELDHMFALIGGTF